MTYSMWESVGYAHSLLNSSCDYIAKINKLLMCIIIKPMHSITERHHMTTVAKERFEDRSVDT